MPRPPSLGGLGTAPHRDDAIGLAHLGASHRLATTASSVLFGRQRHLSDWDFRGVCVCECVSVCGSMEGRSGDIPDRAEEEETEIAGGVAQRGEACLVQYWQCNE